MTVEALRETINRCIFPIYSERYVGENNKDFVERYVCKHPLLRPELIIVNDQLHGFKQVSKKISSLEAFPIYIELEGIHEDGDTCYIEGIDIFTEASINCQNRLEDIIYLSKMYKEFVEIERVIKVGNVKQESLIITSTIQDTLMSMMETGDDETFIELEIFDQLFSKQLSLFAHTIKVLDDVIVKDLKLKEIESKTGFFPSDSEV